MKNVSFENFDFPERDYDVFGSQEKTTTDPRTTETVKRCIQITTLSCNLQTGQLK